MSSSIAFRTLFLFPVFFFLLFFSICKPIHAETGTNFQEEMPKELRQWIPWVLYQQEEKTCTLHVIGANRRYCTWPGSLELDVNNQGATFKQTWTVESRSLVTLPGNAPFWPETVQDNNKNIAVVKDDNNHPALWLDPGKHLVTGKFTWQKFPEHLQVPPATGLVSLTLLGKKINVLQLDEHGRLWFRHKNKAAKNQKETLMVQVFRKIDDNVPLTQQLRIMLVVSGSPREVVLGLETKGTFVPLQLESPLPVRLDKRGRMRLQVRPGQWQIQLTLRNTTPRPPEKISRGIIDGAWPDQEIWVFNSNPKLRQVEVQGIFPVDPSRTSLPGDWKTLPAYLVKNSEQMVLHEKHRGNPSPVPNRLRLERRIWLDESGNGLTARDTITGTMTRGWRLNVDPSLDLGRVEVEGNSRLITKIPGSEKKGVEVRKGSVSLQAESRIKQSVQKARLVIPALGWNHGFEHLQAELNLPPGWKLLTASGVDKVSTWLNRWTLLDIFLVLITVLATARILGPIWGTVALATFILIYHQPGSPRFMWLPLLVLLALQKIISTASGQRIIRVSGLVVLVTIIINAVPFMINEVRVGLFPQLEYGRFYPIIQEHNQKNFRQADEEVANKMLQQQAAVSIKSKKLVGSSHYSLRSSARIPQSVQIDPQAMIQTGPGLPEWNWQKIRLSWNGPVQPEQKVSFILLSPFVNMIIAFIRVLLLALLILGFLRQCLPGRKKNLQTVSASALSLLPTVLFLSCISCLIPYSTAAEIPSPALLQELQNRLLAPPECKKHCAGINSCLIQTDNDLLRVELAVDTLVRGAVPLPGKNRFFDRIELDGQPAEILRLDSQGTSLIRLEPGRHHLILSKNIQGRNKLSFSFPMVPGRGQAILHNWTISGLRENGTMDSQISLARITPAAEENTAENNKVHPAAFVQVERTLHMGLKWSVETRVVRRSPSTAIALAIPLLPGERVTTDGLNIQDNCVRVNMRPEQQVFSWHSAISQMDTLTLSASDTSSWTEHWLLDISPVWHVEASGIPAINQTGSSGKRFPEYHPYPGETLQLAISRPEGVPGPVMTVTRSKIKIKPGRRATEVSLSFSLTASRGLRHAITLPPDIDLQNIMIDNRKYPLQPENNTLVIPVKPGTQEITVGWRSNRGVKMELVSPPVDLGVKSVNTSIEMQVPASRWILLTRGPHIGPAVLFWGELLVIVLIALLLGRIRFTPLSTLQWLLLSLGLSQIPAPFAATVVVWLLLLGLRKTKGSHITGNMAFNGFQVLLVLITIAALASLFGAIQQGLLGHPDMQIGGNGSSGHLLRWYQDRSDSLLPAVQVITVPLLVYRLSMLLWALWLAISLLKWLRWGWECFSDTQMWKKSVPEDMADDE